MVTDWFLDFFAGLLAPVIDLLPSGHLPLPDPSAAAGYLLDINTLVPVLPLLAIVGVLAASVVSFVATRLVFVVRYFLLP